MPTVTKSSEGKNALWAAYQDAGPVKHLEVCLELKAAGVYRHFQSVASKKGHNLVRADGQLMSIFLRLMPETAPLFGLPPIKTDSKKGKPVISNAPTLFE